MRWNQEQESPDVIDRRGQGGGRGSLSPGGILPFVPMLIRSPIGWVVLLVAGGYWAYTSFTGTGSGNNDSGEGRAAPAGQQGRAAPAARADDKEAKFAAFVFTDAQETWMKELAERNHPYRRAKLVLFTDATQTGCGFGKAATGPFYCPADERVYIDLGFFKQLSSRFGARGDFAQAYVVAHEVGHHVQKLMGSSERVHGGSSARGATSASVRLELQADCFAGVWGNSTQQRDLLEAGDIEEALTAAQAIGDDRLQRQASGTVSPESWTHGSSAQRERWYKRGFKSGRLEDCDTFAAADL